MTRASSRPAPVAGRESKRGASDRVELGDRGPADKAPHMQTRSGGRRRRTFPRAIRAACIFYNHHAPALRAVATPASLSEAASSPPPVYPLRSSCILFLLVPVGQWPALSPQSKAVDMRVSCNTDADPSTDEAQAPRGVASAWRPTGTWGL